MTFWRDRHQAVSLLAKGGFAFVAPRIPGGEAEFSPSSTVVEARPVCLAGQSALN
jgi:hypothetical protein